MRHLWFKVEFHWFIWDYLVVFQHTRLGFSFCSLSDTVFAEELFFFHLECICFFSFCNFAQSWEIVFCNFSPHNLLNLLAFHVDIFVIKVECERSVNIGPERAADSPLCADRYAKRKWWARLSRCISLSLSPLFTHLTVWLCISRVLKSCRACWPLGRLSTLNSRLSPVSFISFYVHAHTHSGVCCVYDSVLTTKPSGSGEQEQVLRKCRSSTANRKCEGKPQVRGGGIKYC